MSEYFMSLSAPQMFVLLVAFILQPCIFLYCLIDILRTHFKESATRIKWILVILLIPVLGPILYVLKAKESKAFHP